MMAEIIFQTDAAFERSLRCDAAMRAIGAAAVRSKDLHPNLVTLLQAVKSRVGQDTLESIDDSQRFLKEIASLSKQEQTIVLRVLAAASIIDGRVACDEHKLLVQTWSACGRQFEGATIERLRRNFISGDPIRAQDLEAVQ